MNYLKSTGRCADNMSSREDNLFRYIMEAETELASFDDGGAEDTAPPMDDSAPPDDGADNPPEMNDTGDDFGSFDDGSSDSSLDMGDGSEGTEGESGEEENNQDESMSEKANNILNQKLYEQLCSRNDEIEKVLENLQQLTPVIPSDVFDENEELVSKLKAALNKSKDYAISKFIDSKYGENLFFYNEINMLFMTICDELDKNLKRNFKSKK